jgi:hypothetical protein
MDGTTAVALLCGFTTGIGVICILLLLRITIRGRKGKAIKSNEMRWMYIKVWMKEQTYIRFKRYLDYQGVLLTEEEGKPTENTPDEALNELMILYMQNIKVFDKASARALAKAIKKARGQGK